MLARPEVQSSVRLAMCTIIMNSQIVAVVMVVFAMEWANCAPSARFQPDTIRTSDLVEQDKSASHQGWTTQGYQGPLAVPEVRSDGTLAETPEVAAARAAHLAALQVAVATNPDYDDGTYDPHKYGDHLNGVVSHAEDLTNSIAHYNSLAGGHHRTQELARAQEQAHASAQALASGQAQAHASAQAEADLALWKAKEAATVAAVAAGGYSYGTPAEPNKPYFGPLAMLEVLPSGYLADTLEVATAKRTHLSALAQAAEALRRTKHAQTMAVHRPWN